MAIIDAPKTSRVYGQALVPEALRLWGRPAESEAKSTLWKWKSLAGSFPPQVQVEVIDSFTGRVERIEGSVAHVSLIGRKGDEIYASCNAGELAGEGILEGARFKCLIKKRGKETIVTIEPIGKRKISDEEWEKLRKETAEALADYDPTDDY